jgi:hypothetical protein
LFGLHTYGLLARAGAKQRKGFLKKVI